MKTECPICPDYVVRCWHVNGKAVWMLTWGSCAAEWVRRNLSSNECCLQCDRLVPIIKPYNIAGPGRVVQPNCLCDSGLAPILGKVSDWAGFGTEAEAIAEGERRIRVLG